MRRFAVVTVLVVGLVTVGNTHAMAGYTTPVRITSNRCSAAITTTNAVGTFGFVGCWDSAHNNRVFRYLKGSGTTFKTYPTTNWGDVLAVADDGKTTVAVVRRREGSYERVYVARLNHTGGFIAKRLLRSCPLGSSCVDQATIMARNNTWWAVWSVSINDESADLWQAKTWGTNVAPTMIHTGLVNHEPTIARTSSGGAVLAFRKETDYGHGSIYLGRSQDGAWKFSKLRTGGYRPAIAVSGSTTVVVMLESALTRIDNKVAVMHNYGGSWTTKRFNVPMRFGARTHRPPMIAITKGTIFLGWTRLATGDNTTGYIVKAPVGGTWSAKTLTSSLDQELTGLGGSGGLATVLLSVLPANARDGNDAYVAVRRGS